MLDLDDNSLTAQEARYTLITISEIGTTKTYLINLEYRLPKGIDDYGAELLSKGITNTI